MSESCSSDLTEEVRKLHALLECEEAEPIVERAVLPDGDPDFFISPFRNIQWFSLEKSKLAVSRTGKDLRKGITDEILCKLVNEIIAASLMPFIESLIPDDEWERLLELATQVIEYAQLVEKFRAHAFPVASIPEEILVDIEHLMGTGGPVRVSKKTQKFYWEREFYPRILGLYAACFGAPPSAHAYTQTVRDQTGGVSAPSEQDKLVFGTTAGFIDVILESISERLEDEDVQSAFPYHKTLDLLREASDPPALRGRIARWKKVAADGGSASSCAEEMSWIFWRRFIEGRLKLK